MRCVQVRFLDDGRQRAALARVDCAEHFIDRCRGLLGRPPPPADGGLLIRPCGSIHTFGMRYPLDIIWLDRADRILRLVPMLPPGRMALCRGARSVLELATGQISRLGLVPGMEVIWSPTCT